MPLAVARRSCRSSNVTCWQTCLPRGWCGDRAGVERAVRREQPHLEWSTQPGVGDRGLPTPARPGAGRGLRRGGRRGLARPAGLGCHRVGRVRGGPGPRSAARPRRRSPGALGGSRTGGGRAADRGFDLVSAQYPALLHTPDHAPERALLSAVAPGGTLLVVHLAIDVKHGQAHGFAPADYVSLADVASLLDENWALEIDEERPRHIPTGAGAHHTRDVVLRARRLS